MVVGQKQNRTVARRSHRRERNSWNQLRAYKTNLTRQVEINRNICLYTSRTETQVKTQEVLNIPKWLLLTIARQKLLQVRVVLSDRFALLRLSSLIPQSIPRRRDGGVGASAKGNRTVRESARVVFCDSCYRGRWIIKNNDRNIIRRE